MIDRNSVKNSVKLFENCTRRYIMVVQKGGRSRLRGHEEKEV